MTQLRYVSLSGVGDPQEAMRETRQQYAPYRDYLERAIAAARDRGFTVSWRSASPYEVREFERRSERKARASQRWVVLETNDETPESTLDAFLEAREVKDRAFRVADERAGIEVRAVDREGLGLLLERLPREVSPAVRTLFLTPSFWPITCQLRALEALRDLPVPRLAPLARLAVSRPSWGPVTPAKVDEHDWAFLKTEPNGALRDGTSEQREFVRRALGTPDFAILEGPPGSGKTTAICELIVQLVRGQKRVLLVASTHVAVDNVLERLVRWQGRSEDKPVMPIRIGDEGKITSPDAKQWSLEALEPTWRGEILSHLARPVRGTPAGDAARQLMKRSLVGSDENFRRLLVEASNLVCGTTIGILKHPSIAAGATDGEPFDVMILDEASKTTFTEFLAPAIHAERWVVVGDRRQLSPYVAPQDLAENIQRLVPPESAKAALHSFRAEHHPRGALIAVESAQEATALEAETTARGLVAVHLDSLDPQKTHLELLGADLVYGSAPSIERWEHRLPGDLARTAGKLPPLPDWRAHQAVVSDRNEEDESTSWAGEIGWRQTRAFELRTNPAEQQTVLRDLERLQPRALGAEYLGLRPPRKIGGRLQTAQEALREDLEQLRRVSMPSILEVLQAGAGSGLRQATALTSGIPANSLSERLVSLSFQHRMHPDISAFPRERFYAADGLLKDASNLAALRHWSYARYASRARFIEIESRSNTSSNRNPAEADALIKELEHFVKWAATAPREGGWEVAVLTFYAAQQHELRQRLRTMSRQRANTNHFDLPAVRVTLCTVDGFQGHEADVVFLSFVRNQSVGFLNSPSRLNVALTRARSLLVMFGNRRWMRTTRGLLSDLASSSHYGRDLQWEYP